ncbi:uncharacterized protein LOC106088040 [Stomoxys calcitrans]|uniref:Uncharacterized protein n=1 Tax=Stomoxys calcitrans TaxID=35570 RepID=A0A1I8Q0I8_STOCA|nr:uncharacterized protein LOC106088040 [Stomoxys calcitrans]
MCSHAGYSLFIAYTTLAIFSILLIAAIGLLADKNLLQEVITELTVEQDADLAVYATSLGIRLAIILLLIVGIVMVIVSYFLIKGIHKHRPMHMIPWLLIMFVHIIGGLVYNLVVLLTSSSPAVDFIIGMTCVAVLTAIFYPIYTLYKAMRKGGNLPPPPQIV